MTESRGQTRLLHPALEEASGVALAEAQLSDRQRLAVVLQGAALLVHLERAGWRLDGGWDHATVTAEGRLQIVESGPGRLSELPQVLLLDLLRRVFRSSDGSIAGRGEARRVARLFAGRWRQALAPSSADRAVAEILDEALFLWQPSFAVARTALVAEHWVGSRRQLWLAGPGAARRRFLGGCRDRGAVEERLRGPRARDLWEGWRADADPRRLAERGRLRRAVAVWRRDPPEDASTVLLYARSLFDLGRYSQVLQVLGDRSSTSTKSVSTRLLRAWCQHHLGELGAARTTVRRLARAELSPEHTIELAEIAIRIHGARGERSAIADWIQRLPTAVAGSTGLLASITAAGACWDLKDLEAMDLHLEAASAAREDPELAGRWHHMRGQRSLAVLDGLGAVEHISAALRLDRRRLSGAAAGRLWNDLAIGRTYSDDLAGAERACRHALRLLSEVEGPSSTTLASYNLAEVMLRRGRVEGVEKTLELSTAENRRAGNQRTLIRDFELWARYELAQGRAAAALARCSEAVRWMEQWDLYERRAVFEVLAARAYGWSARPAEASACLERVTSEDLRELAAEERPAVWALASRPRQASEEAARTPWEEIWSSLAAGVPPSIQSWSAVDDLEPYRAARLIFDCELILPGSVPPERIRNAVTQLRRAGAEALSERLENRSLSPWKALKTYLAEPETKAGDAGRLLAAAGYGDVRLSWRKPGVETVLIDGRGGDESRVGSLGTGELMLSAPLVDSVLEALFELVRRDLEVPREGPARPLKPQRGGIVGESSELLAALARLDLLARGELPILILGESGTGKELFARQAHRISRRSSKPFLAVNCAALPETLIQSDLFGHVKGSFTGADRDREGVFETVRGGTVFLDEIGDLPIAVQGQLLRVLQEGEVRRVGESFARKVDVRIVAATHRDLEKMVEQGTFRQDLFFRLKVATIILPPLRQRGEDVLRLAKFFLARIATESVPPRLSQAARRRLMSHSWPGNVRELNNVLEVAVAICEDEEIGEEHLELPRLTTSPRGEYHQLLDDFRKQLVTAALAESGGNRAQAARKLGLTRQALSYLVRRLGLV